MLTDTVEYPSYSATAQPGFMQETSGLVELGTTIAVQKEERTLNCFAARYAGLGRLLICGRLQRDFTAKIRQALTDSCAQNQEGGI